MSEAKDIEGISDLTPDPENANLGTERGLRMLDDSLREDGAGRSILVDRDGVTIAGAKTLERAADIGLPIRVVQTDGNELVVVQRTDLDLDGEGEEQVRARRMAYRDNRSSEVSLSWNVDQLLADVKEGIDLAGVWHDWEIENLLAGVADEAIDPMAEWEGMPEFENEDQSPLQSIVVHFMDLADVTAFASLVQQTITDKTKSVWYPKRQRYDLGGVVYSDES